MLLANTQSSMMKRAKSVALRWFRTPHCLRFDTPGEYRFGELSRDSKYPVTWLYHSRRGIVTIQTSVLARESLCFLVLPGVNFVVLGVQGYRVVTGRDPCHSLIPGASRWSKRGQVCVLGGVVCRQDFLYIASPYLRTYVCNKMLRTYVLLNDNAKLSRAL